MATTSVLHDRAVENALGYRDVTPADVAGAASGAPLRLVDVREPHEFVGELGHVAGAELVPLAVVESAASRWDPDDEIVLICRSGARSGRAASLLRQLGFRRVMNMVGGMLAWNAEGRPVERG